MKYVFVFTAFGLLSLIGGCDSMGNSPATQPANVAADGRNLSPELQKDFGHDPRWPNDADPGFR